MRWSILVPTVVATSLSLPGAAAAQDRQETLGELPDAAWPASITSLQDSLTALEGRITGLEERISPFESTTRDAGTTVIALASDILFAFDEATVEGTAREKIADLLADVPQGAKVEIGGHTDSISDDAYNQELSERRAEAVAAVVQKVRPDLHLQVRGYGESRPVAENTAGGEDNPEGRALNRRVEIRYQG